MSDKKKYLFNRISKFPGALTGKAMELPRSIIPEEMSNIIARGCKSTHHMKRFKHLESYTPSPSQESRIRPERISETPAKFEDCYSRGGDNSSIQKMGKKILQLKSKNMLMKESLRQIETKYKSQILILRKENEKLIQNNKLLKKEQYEEKNKLEELIYQLKFDVNFYKNSLESFIKSISELITAAVPNCILLKDEFNKVLIPRLSKLSPEMSCCVFVEPVEFITTGQFRETINFSDSIESSVVTTKEAIVMKCFKPQVHGELELKLGDRVTILKGDEGLMWLGKLKERVGLFPSSHVMLD